MSSLIGLESRFAGLLALAADWPAWIPAAMAAVYPPFWSCVAPPVSGEIKFVVSGNATPAYLSEAIMYPRKPAEPPVVISERVNPNPPGVRPRAHSKHGGKLVGIRLGAGWNQLIQSRNHPLERLLACGGGCRDLIRGRAEMRPDLDLDVFKPAFTPKASAHGRMRNRESAQDRPMPMAGGFEIKSLEQVRWQRLRYGCVKIESGLGGSRSAERRGRSRGGQTGSERDARRLQSGSDL